MAKPPVVLTLAVRRLPGPGRSTTALGRNIDRTEWNTEPTEPIFGRTDLRKGVSEAKFNVEADFDVKKSLAPPKSAENHEKPKTKSQNNFRKKKFRRQKMESCKSSETRFPEVSWRSERSSRGERTFVVVVAVAVVVVAAVVARIGS